jgi:glutamate synthase domain-containing protein 2
MRSFFIWSSLLTLILQTTILWTLNSFWWTYIFTAPIILLGIYDMYQTKHTIKATYPLVGRFRYWMEILRPKIYQYFIESNTDGTPISRIERSVVYQRSKGELDSAPFGTQLDVYEVGYEWMNHSLYPLSLETIDHNMRVVIGGKDCLHPYNASILNISAMSFGSLSKHAIRALNLGAKLGGFAHNTGEGGLSPHHLQEGGDIIWQIGTGYFGCRNAEGRFDAEKFTEKAKIPQVKMIEIKLSQGAKPGHGGILPAKKNTPEIALIRGVTPYTRVLSPSGHREFHDYHGMIDFIELLRKLSGGKPIGIKLCIGHHREFKELCQTMKERNSFPDYIAIDGGEGGTGAAPLEFTNSVGTPMREGLAYAHNTLLAKGIRNELKLLASGKILSGFNMARTMALGADACYAARGMMLALGCIQALECNSNNCPAGIATQNPQLYKGLNINNKGDRIRNFHRETLIAFAEMLGAAGLKHPSELTRDHIIRRVSNHNTLSYAEIYPLPDTVNL